MIVSFFRVHVFQKTFPPILESVRNILTKTTGNVAHQGAMEVTLRCLCSQCRHRENSPPSGRKQCAPF